MQPTHPAIRRLLDSIVLIFLISSCTYPASNSIPTKNLTQNPYPEVSETPTPTVSLTPTFTLLPDVYLASLTPDNVSVGFGSLGVGIYVVPDKSFNGKPIKAHGQYYPNGLMAHAPSSIDYHLDGQYRLFRTQILKQDNVDCGDGVIFTVLLDGQEIYSSPVVFSSDAPRNIELDVSGAHMLSLVVDENFTNDCDWAIWGEPRLVRAAGSAFIPSIATETKTPSATAVSTPASTRPPFVPCTAGGSGGIVELWKCPFQPRADFIVGGTVADYLAKRDWNHYWKTNNPLKVMKDNGFQWIRVLTTTVDLPLTKDWSDANWSSRAYTAKIIKEALAMGYHIDLAFFLSDKAAHAGIQDAPPEWAGLTPQDTAVKLEQYTYDTTKYFMDNGLNVELYEIGNEIEWGILNFRPGERIPIPAGIDKTQDSYYMKYHVWNTEALLLNSAIAGVKRANPNAQIVLHVDSTLYFPNADITTKEFFKTMLEQKVPFNYAGLSVYGDTPAAAGMTQAQYFGRLQKVLDYLDGLGLRVLICEAGYPATDSNPAEHPLKDYPFTPQGQALWIQDSLRFFSNNPDVFGYFYFYPDQIINMEGDKSYIWGLFQDDTTANPGLSEFRVNLYP